MLAHDGDILAELLPLFSMGDNIFGGERLAQSEWLVSEFLFYVSLLSLIFAGDIYFSFHS